VSRSSIALRPGLETIRAAENCGFQLHLDLKATIFRVWGRVQKIQRQRTFVFVLDPSVGTSRDQRLLRNNMRASLIAIRVNQVENKSLTLKLLQVNESFLKLCCTTSSASSRLRLSAE